MTGKAGDRNVDSSCREHARNIEFAGKGSGHSKQIAALNEVFTPPGNQFAQVRTIVEFNIAETDLVVCDSKLTGAWHHEVERNNHAKPIT